MSEQAFEKPRNLTRSQDKLLKIKHHEKKSSVGEILYNSVHKNTSKNDSLFYFLLRQKQIINIGSNLSFFTFANSETLINKTKRLLTC